MLNNKEIIALASDTAISDSRQTKIASDVLKILAENSVTVSEAKEILNSVDCMISRARIDFSNCTVAQDLQSKKNVPAKTQKQNSLKIDFTDGGYISYDASISKLDIYCPGEISINGKFLRLQE